MSSSESKPSFTRLKLSLAGFVVIAVAIVAIGLMSRATESQQLNQWTATYNVPNVALVKPQIVENQEVLELPGQLEAIKRADIYAQVSGYLHDWHVEIGAKVNAGQLLAQIDTPDIDQQLAQAKADLGVAKANAELARSTAKRWQTLAKTQVVSAQDNEQRVSALNVGLAEVEAAQANVNRLEVQKQYAAILAPFDGIVTKRSTDIGTLVNAGGQPLYEISDVSQLYLYIRVPQNYLRRVTLGTVASITIPENPRQTYSAKVVNSSRSVTQGSGTVLMQLLVDNPAGELSAGGFATVSLALQSPENVLSLPASALIFDAQGTSIATVDQDNRIVIKTVTIARDLGRIIEIESGLSAQDKVVANPPDGIKSGAKVQVVGDETAMNLPIGKAVSA